MLLNNTKTRKKPCKPWLKIGALALAATLLAPSVHAAKMRAQCYLLDKDNQKVEGVDIHHPYEIASVSKVFTAFWATATRGVNYRFPTKLYIRPIANGAVDIHLEGSWDPYFNRDQFQYLITQLNALNVTSINSLTFDENFKFAVDTRGTMVKNIPIGHYQLDDPSPTRVLMNLKLFSRALASGYPVMKAQAKKINGVDLPATFKMKIGTVAYQSKADFSQDAGFAHNSRQMVMLSVPLHEILKEMNRNSNNYAANLIFQSLGGADKFEKFITKTLKTGADEVSFVNGSGDRLDLAGGKSAYNEASCDAIVRTIAAFRESLQQQKMELEHVMALAGEDPSAHEKSTVSNIYGSEATADALIAKTGTVNPSVTLAGMASTEEGDVYFGIIYGTKGSKADWTSARTQIRGDVLKMFKKFHNKKEIDYDATQFMAFDQGSHLRESTQAPVSGKSLIAQFAKVGKDNAAQAAMTPSMNIVPPVDSLEIVYSDADGGRLP